MTEVTGNVVPLAAQRLISYRTDDLSDVADIVRELLSYEMVPDDLAARLNSFRDDIHQALADREDKNKR